MRNWLRAEFQEERSPGRNDVLNVSCETPVRGSMPAHTEVEVMDAFSCYRGQVCAYARSILHDATVAEDITQETFLRYFEELRHGRPIYNAKAWLFRAAHNIALNQRRDHQKLSQLDEPLLPATRLWGAAPQFAIADERVNPRLKAALRQLSPQEQRCIELRAEGLLYREIADLLGVRISSVSNYVERAIGKLRQAVNA